MADPGIPAPRVAGKIYLVKFAECYQLIFKFPG
jgi:hypothetical protein